ncbi:hypothetical protein ACFSO7_10370 [Bacillus sp. CGMCC 1.16607]|uniref:hypothetical protein n=1 Tax=Bacillus sp. CGMCC 1.16607 TaxID=3351842 RepID=UPI0036453E4F
MNVFHWYVIFTLLLTTLLSMIFAIRKKSTLVHMPGMVISMYLGMNVGLTAGVLFGSIYQGNLYLSTILAMLLGIVAGTLCGLIFGVLPAIEGFMAGVMGGMMGAMLGEMITIPQSSIMIKIFLTLTLCTILLFFILPKHSEHDEIKNKKWFLKPIGIIVLIVFYLIIGNQLKSFPSKSTPQMEHYHH